MAREHRPWTQTEVAIANPLIKAMSRVNAWVYRATGGRIGGTWLRGAPVFLLTTIGRKSGRALTIPLLYLRDGDRFVVVASKGGMDHHPLWYLNLEAHPDVEVELAGTVTKVRARTATPDERAALWPRLIAMYRDYADYQERTERVIPVVILTPR